MWLFYYLFVCPRFLFETNTNNTLDVIAVVVALDGDDVNNDGDNDEVDTEDAGITCTWSL